MFCETFDCLLGTFFAQVMVMSAGQRTYLLNRNIDKTDVNVDSLEEEYRSGDKLEAVYADEEDYPRAQMTDVEQQTTTAASRKRPRVKAKDRTKSRKREKPKAIGPKLSNLSRLRDI